jgi:hypothetical protein
MIVIVSIASDHESPVPGTIALRDLRFQSQGSTKPLLESGTPNIERAA